MMNKNKFLGFILAVVGAVLVLGGLYLLVSYLSYLGQGLITFVSTNNVQAISRCGIVVPEMFVQMRDQFATTIVPVLYLGIPLAVVFISAIWFASGYYFGKGRIEEAIEMEIKKEEHIEAEVEKRIAERKSRSGSKRFEEGPEEEETGSEMPEEEEEEPVRPSRRR